MRSYLPSGTAVAVSLLRALSSLPAAPFDTVGDRSLRALVPRPIDGALSALGTITARAPGVHGAMRAVSLGLFDHVALRTRAIDEALIAALEGGASQLVLLGAGLDARAFRMTELHDATVFEIDHPATQALKKARVARLAPRCARHVWAPIDFSSGSLDRTLHEAGHDASARTVWIWEGVTPYLSPDAITATLTDVTRRSAKGSVLLVTYVLPSLATLRSIPFEAPMKVIRNGPVRAAFGALGEPLLGAMTTDALMATCEPLGWSLRDDTGSDDWGRAHLRAEPTLVRIEERLANLVRT